MKSALFRATQGCYQFVTNNFDLSSFRNSQITLVTNTLYHNHPKGSTNQVMFNQCFNVLLNRVPGLIDHFKVRKSQKTTNLLYNTITKFS